MAARRIVPVLASLLRAVLGGSTVSLDAGWRFHLDYESAFGCGPEELPLPLAGKQCPGLRKQGRPEDGGPNGTDSCAAACCGDDSCNAWQWCPWNSTCHPAGSCWVGFSAAAASEACSDEQGWEGGWRRSLPPAPVPLDSCISPECRPDFDDSSWRAIQVPHDFVVEGNFRPEASMAHGYLPYGVGWYRRAFLVQAEGNESLWLDFQGVMAACRVWLNGFLLGEHRGGYTPFRFDLGKRSSLSKAVKWGAQNMLAVRVDATKPDSWWYDGGGIYRHVSLTTAAPVHIAQWGVYAAARVLGSIDTGTLTASAEVLPSVEVENDGAAAARVKVRCEVRDSAGRVAGGAESLAATALPGHAVTLSLPAIRVSNASLWTLERPSLYTLATSLLLVQQEGAGEGCTEAGACLTEVEETSFGIRQVTWSPEQGLELNGVMTKILGVCNHQDFPAVGVAVPDVLQEYRVRSMKDLGMNAWRTAHNPPNPALLDATDKLGMLVWDENHRNGNDDEMSLMVRRDRNHPSIIIWSVCNEVLCSTENTIQDMTRLRDIARRLDPLMGRLVSANEDSILGPKSPMDLQGFDYSPESYDDWHKQAPGKPSVGSEVSSAVSDRGEYVNSREEGHVTGFDTEAPSWGSTAEKAWKAILDRPFVAGGFTWTGWDYRGEPTPYAWPDVTSHFGILDAAGFWKDRAYWYKAWFAQPDPPLLYVFPHWTWSLEICQGACQQDANGTLHVDVWAFSNAQEVELWLPDGRSLGRRQMERHGHVEWKAVPFSPGRLRAAAFVAGGQEPTTEVQVETTGQAQAIRLAFRDGVGALSEGPEGIALITAELVDAAGRVVPNAAGRVTFTVGHGLLLLGTANGDPACRVPNTAAARPAFHGLVLAVLRRETQAQALALSSSYVEATSPGLASARLPIQLTPSQEESAQQQQDRVFV